MVESIDEKFETTDPKKAVFALKWVVREMENRYKLMSPLNVKNIDSYNDKVLKTISSGRKLYREVQTGIDDDSRMPIIEKQEILLEKMPFIVVVIDEMADLMMVAGKEVESLVQRLAQMARAIGIHLVVATQRPSVDVITGVMKANIPSRLAFSVASTTDSRVILDQSGAEKLIGLGDMLVVTASNPRLERIQGAWVNENEVQDVVSWVKEQKEAEYNSAVTEEQKQTTNSSNEDFGEDEELIKTAKELVVRSQMGSTSMLQRKLRVGFARAGRLMDILEAQGIVGPSEGSKAREVLITIEEFETDNLSSIEDSQKIEEAVSEEVVETAESKTEEDNWFEE